MQDVAGLRRGVCLEPPAVEAKRALLHEVLDCAVAAEELQCRMLRWLLLKRDEGAADFGARLEALRADAVSHLEQVARGASYVVLELPNPLVDVPTCVLFSLEREHALEPRREDGPTPAEEGCGISAPRGV